MSLRDVKGLRGVTYEVCDESSDEALHLAQYTRKTGSSVTKFAGFVTILPVQIDATSVSQQKLKVSATFRDF